GTGLTNVRGKSLYDFWGSRITQALNQSLSREKQPVLVNLASNEYFKSVRPRELNARVISPVFKDYSNGQYKIVSFFAKKARGLMSAYIIQNRLKNPDRLLDFDSEGYRYSAEHSRPDAPVFLRKSA
ncbi:MAG: peroxide stress protein YaaA, partial [Candidatus Competibacteraceae bacterium]|nr:peroxide stress protein YaaA [Candidatus Competibacteraceae bacterium]